MKAEILSLLSFGLGAGSSLLSTYLTNKNQLKRDNEKYKNDLLIQERKNEFEIKQNYRIELLADLERLNNIVGKLENSISLTSSVIESDKKLAYQDFDAKYQEELNGIIEVESLVISKFTEMHDTICKISGLHNQYWGNQRLLLMIDIKEEKERYIRMQRKIIEVANETASEIAKVRRKSLELGYELRHKYLA